MSEQKLDYNQLIEMGSAGLRCWHAIDGQKDDFNKGWHAGKAYAYLFVCQQAKLLDFVLYQHSSLSTLKRATFMRQFRIEKRFLDDVLALVEKDYGQDLRRDIINDLTEQEVSDKITSLDSSP